MKKPIEYLLTEMENLHEADQPYFDDDDATLYDGNSQPIFRAIEQAQKDAYNQALEDAAENVEMGEEDPMPFSYCDCPEYFIDKQSILKLKKK